MSTGSPTTENARLASTCAVVLNWNLTDLTLGCIRALVDEGISLEQIVVVDNGSTDDSVTRLEAEAGACRLVSIPSNIGYARASNAGARERPESETYLFVNNDAFVHRPGSILRLVEAVHRDRIGIAVPRLLNSDLTLQPSVVPLVTPKSALVRVLGLSRFVPNAWQPRWGVYWDHGRSEVVDAAHGTVTAVRGDLWRSLDGYAERDLMFSEDLDLCWRSRKRGFRTWFEHGAEFVHLGNASGARHWSDARRAEMVTRSDAAMIRAELDPVRAYTTIGLLCVGLVARLAVFSATGNRAAARWSLASLRGYLRRTHARSAGS